MRAHPGAKCAREQTERHECRGEPQEEGARSREQLGRRMKCVCKERRQHHDGTGAEQREGSTKERPEKTEIHPLLLLARDSISDRGIKHLSERIDWLGTARDLCATARGEEWNSGDTDLLCFTCFLLDARTEALV